jgi:ribosomal protein S18 acetylase RimI-like enzyme
MSGNLLRFDAANQAAHVEIAERSDGRVETIGDFLLVIGAHPSWVIANVAFPRVDRAEPAPNLDAQLHEVLDRFREAGNGVHLLTADHLGPAFDDAARAAGWELAFSAPGMIAERVVDPSRPTDAELTWVEDAHDLTRFRRVEKEGFADDEDEREMIDAVFADIRSVEPPGMRAVIASTAGEDAAAAAVYLHDGVATIGLVGTIPRFRRRGLGGLVTAAAANAGFELGADTAFLIASPMGEPVYRRIGFRTIEDYRFWLPPSDDTPARASGS